MECFLEIQKHQFASVPIKSLSAYRFTTTDTSVLVIQLTLSFTEFRSSLVKMKNLPLVIIKP